MDANLPLKALALQQLGRLKKHINALRGRYLAKKTEYRRRFRGPRGHALGKPNKAVFYHLDRGALQTPIFVDLGQEPAGRDQ